MHDSIKLCPPKLHPTYFGLAVLTYIAPPVLFAIYNVLRWFLEEDYSKTTIGLCILPCIMLGFIPSFLILYFYLPFLSVYHGIQGFYKDRFRGVERFMCIEDERDLPFLKLFEQFGEALPQFMLGLTFYVNNTYFINTYDNIFNSILPTTLISVIFSGVSVVLGLISGLVTSKSAYDDGLLG